jgi:hypothetical protein
MHRLFSGGATQRRGLRICDQGVTVTTVPLSSAPLVGP